MPSEEALDLIDLLDEDPSIARNIDWDFLSKEEPDLNVSRIRSEFLERLGLSQAVGLRTVTKEEFETPKTAEPVARPIDADIEAEKISAVARLSGIPLPSTLAFPHRIERPLDLPEVRPETEIPTARVEPVSTGVDVPISPVARSRALEIEEPARIGEPTGEIIPLKPEEIADIQAQLESERETGNQKLEAVLSYLPEKFVKFGTDQYKAMKLLAQLATQPEIEIEGQKIPTHEVVAELPSSVGEHYLGYLQDPLSKIKEDPFAALLDAFIIRGVATSAIKGARALAGRRLAPTVAKLKAPITGEPLEPVLKEVLDFKIPRGMTKSEILTNPRVEEAIMDRAARNVIELTRRGERGGAIIPTSEELTLLGTKLEKANLYTRFIGEPLYNQLSKLAGDIVPERMQRFFLERYGQPAEWVTTAQKNMTDMGLNIEKSMEWGKQAGKNFTRDDMLNIRKAVTDPKRLGIETVRGTEYEPVVRRMQADMTRLGAEAKDLGLIAQESYDFFTGRYLPKLHKEPVKVTVLPGRKMGFSARLKQRGRIREIPIEELGKFEAEGWELFTDLGNGRAKIRQFVPHGTVEDPFVAWAKGVSDLEHDIAIAKTMRFVGENPNWVSATPKEGFIKLPRSKTPSATEDRFLRASGLENKYVHKEIVTDLRELYLTKSDWRKLFDQMTSMWKIGKTAFNPATHSRNIVSNAILADMGGLSPIRRWDVYLESAKQFTSKGKFFNEAKAGGLFGKEFQHEINQMFRGVSNAKNPISFWSKLNKAYTQGAPARWYQAEEQFFKMAKFIHNRQKGMSVTESVADAHKWLFDYSTVSPFVNLGRRTFFPFITFQAKALPRITETAIKHPLRIAKYWAAYEAYNRYSKSRLGLTDEQYKEIRENTPEYIRKGGMWLLLPERDNNGNYQFRNMTYFMPWGDIISGGSSGGGPFASLPEPLQNIAVPSHPLVRLPFEIALNRSIFFDRDIWRADENPWVESAEYAAETLGPSIATQHVPRLYSRLVERRPNYFGERETAVNTLQGLIGARPVSVNIERSAFFDIIQLEKEMKALESRYFSIENDQSISNDERQKKLDHILEQIQKLELKWNKKAEGPASRFEG